MSVATRLDVYDLEICLTAKERRKSVAPTKEETWRKKCGENKGGYREEREKEGEGKREGWKIERGWYVEGLSVRIIFTEKEEKVEDEELEEDEEEETLPLFVVAGETKNGG